MGNASIVQVSLQDLNQTAFSKHKIFFRWDNIFGLTWGTPFLLEGKIRRITAGLNEVYGEVEIEFPSKPFGTHVNWMTPVYVYINDTNNMVFRGFITDEDAVLDRSNDQMTAILVDYKWMLGKLAKIRGKIYTVDNNVKPMAGFFTNISQRVFLNEKMFEKFKYTVPGGTDNIGRVPIFSADQATGFLGGIPTIFNENGDPDCAANDVHSRDACCFKYDPDDLYDYNLRIHTMSKDIRYYWNYATILKYISDYYIENYFRGYYQTANVHISPSSLANIQRWGDSFNQKSYIIPDHLEITGLSPAQAIDKVVKSIIGCWSWRIVYGTNTNSIIIEVNNNIATRYYCNGFTSAATKSLFIGDGGKINDEGGNNVNVASIRARRSIRDAISHVVAVGGNIEIETSIQYLAGWEQYLRPDSDVGTETDENWSIWDGKYIPSGCYVSNFKNNYDYEKWQLWINKAYNVGGQARAREVISSADELRYARIFRVFTFPKNKDQLTTFPNVYIDSLIPSSYNGLVTYLHELIFSHVIVPRRVKNPLTNYMRDNLPLKSANIIDEKSGASRYQRDETKNSLFVFIYDAYNASISIDDGSGGGGVPDATEQALLDLYGWKAADAGENDSNVRQSLSHSFDSDNRVIIFEHPQCEQMLLSEKHGNEPVMPSNFRKVTSRKVFCTCRIECDVPLIEDKLDSSARALYANARFVSQDIVDRAKFVIRTNAFYPRPTGYNGQELSYEDNDGIVPPEGLVGGIRTTGNVGDYPLVDWNTIDGNGEGAIKIIDDTYLLKQVIEIMLGSVPLYTEEFDVDLGRIDTSYKVGDRIDKIVNSEDADGTPGSGYFNLNAYIDHIEIMPIDEGDAYTTRMHIVNNIPPNLPHIAERRI